MDHCHVPVLFAGFHSLYKEYGTRIIKRKEKKESVLTVGIEK